MLSSYLGIATPRGLERLCPEHPDAARFLSVHVSRLRRQRAVLVWAVMSEDAAEAVCEELRWGDKRAALDLLQTAARECGRVVADDRSTGTF